MPALEGEVADLDQAVVRRDARPRQGFVIPGQSIRAGGHVLRTGDRRHPPPSLADEVLHRGTGTTAVVDVDVGDAGSGRTPADHDRNAAALEIHRERVRPVERDEQDAVGMTGGEVALHPKLVGSALRHEQHELEFLLREGVAYAAQDAWEERIAEEVPRWLRNDDRDRVTPSGDEAARGAVRAVAELLHRRLDRRSGVAPDAWVAVHDARHRRSRHARAERYLLEGGRSTVGSPLHRCESALTITEASYGAVSRERSHAAAGRAPRRLVS